MVVLIMVIGGRMDRRRKLFARAAMIASLSTLKAPPMIWIVWNHLYHLAEPSPAFSAKFHQTLFAQRQICAAFEVSPTDTALQWFAMTRLELLST